MKENDLIEVYNKYMELTDTLLRENISAIEVAPIMIKLGLEIYKTVMSPEDYDRMVDFISDHRDDVRDLSDFLPEIH